MASARSPRKPSSFSAVSHPRQRKQRFAPPPKKKIKNNMEKYGKKPSPKGMVWGFVFFLVFPRVFLRFLVGFSLPKGPSTPP